VPESAMVLCRRVRLHVSRLSNYVVNSNKEQNRATKLDCVRKQPSERKKRAPRRAAFTGRKAYKPSELTQKNSHDTSCSADCAGYGRRGSRWECSAVAKRNAKPTLTTWRDLVIAKSPEKAAAGS